MPRIERLPLPLDPAAKQELAAELVTGAWQAQQHVCVCSYAPGNLQANPKLRISALVSATFWHAVEHFLVRPEDIDAIAAGEEDKKEVGPVERLYSSHHIYACDALHALVQALRVLLLHLQNHLAAPVRSGVQLLRQLEVDARILPFLCSRRLSLLCQPGILLLHSGGSASTVAGAYGSL